ncbi:MAG TPA: hypothetical protein VJ746_10090 [Nitrospira sp.]|nr:hypothetical protein [Nitrospira sp.]
MADLLNDLKVRIGADISQFKDAMSKVNDQLGSVSDFARLAGKGLAALSVVGGLGKLAADVTEVALAAGKQAEELQNLSAITGRNTQSLQQWDVLLNRVGLSQSDLAMGLKTLSQKVEEARQGAGNAADRFRQMGIDITKVSSTDQILRAIAESSSKMANGMEKNAAMTDLLGRMGSRLIPAFEGGAKAIDEAAKKSAAMTELSGIQIKVLGDMDDSVDDLNKSWERFSQQLGALVAPSVQMIVEGLTWLLNVGARVFKEIDTAADTLAIRFTHVALAINEAASVLFSSNLFNGDAWKQALANIALIDQEAAKLIAKRRELANASEGKDTRSAVPTMIDSKKALDEARALADAELKITEQLYKAAGAQWKAYADHTIAGFEELKQKFVVNDVDMAEAHAKVSKQMRDITQQSLVEQISNYSEWADHRINLEKAGSKEREAIEGQVNAKLVEMWNQVVLNQITGDSERMRSAIEVAKAKQDQANKEAEMGYQRFQLYQKMTEREKQLDVDVASAHLAMIEAQEGVNAGYLVDYRRILDAKLASIAAEEAKELASATITEEQKATIAQNFAAQRIQAETEYTNNVRAQHQTILSDNAKLADAAFNVAKAQYDAQFTLFRDTDALRAMKAKALDAQYQADIANTQLTAQAKLAIEQNYQAQLMSLSQQFPTFWVQQLQMIQQSAAFTWSSITQSFATSLAGVIQGTATMAQFFQQALNTMLTAVIQLGIQLLANWMMTETARAATTQAANAAITGSNAAMTASSMTMFAAMGAAVKTMMIGVAHAVVGVASAAVGVITTVLEGISYVLSIALQSIADMIFAAAAAVQGIPIIGQILGAVLMAGGAAVVAAATALPAIVMGVGAALSASVAAVAAAIPAFASGGIVTGPTLGLVGEAGPEVIAPLSQLDSMLGGGEQTIVIQLDGRELGRTVLQHMPSIVYARTGRG